MDEQLADSAHLRAAERAENFPVALRVLPARVRGHLRAIYDVVRTVDDVGDDPTASPAERLVRLDVLDVDLGRLWSGEPAVEPVVRRLAPTVAACALPHEPFERLVEANRRDQRVTEYATRAELLDYCALSAAPIGRLVLAVAAADDSSGRSRRLLDEAEVVSASDRVCTALQLLEHWADVAEDRRLGRVYLPAEDRGVFGVTENDLDAPVASAGLRRLVEHETAWATELADAGPALVGHLRGWARRAVAGYVAGGRAAADALRRTSGDVLGATPRTRRRDVARHLVTLMARSSRAARSSMAAGSSTAATSSRRTVR